MSFTLINNAVIKIHSHHVSNLIMILFCILCWIMHTVSTMEFFTVNSHCGHEHHFPNSQTKMTFLFIIYSFIIYFNNTQIPTVHASRARNFPFQTESEHYRGLVLAHAWLDAVVLSQSDVTAPVKTASWISSAKKWNCFSKRLISPGFSVFFFRSTFHSSFSTSLDGL